jgi:hypothetical protein
MRQKRAFRPCDASRALTSLCFALVTNGRENGDATVARIDRQSSRLLLFVQVIPVAEDCLEISRNA